MLSLALLFLILVNISPSHGQWGLLPAWGQTQSSGGCGTSDCPTPSCTAPSCGASPCGGGSGGCCGGNVCPFPMPEKKFEQPARNTCTNARTKCYMNTDNYMCCNRELESYLRCLTSNCVNQQRWRGSNLQRMATDVQGLLQEKYCKSFEVVSGSEDFCGKHSFKGDLMCKIRTSDCKTLMAYATPVQYSIDPCKPNTPLSQKECSTKATAWGPEGFENTDI